MPVFSFNYFSSKKQQLGALSLAFISLSLASGCNGSGNSNEVGSNLSDTPSLNSTATTNSLPQNQANNQPQTRPQNNNPPAVARTYTTGALIFKGEATATGDAESLAAVLDAHKVTYKILNSAQMDAISLDDLSKFGMIVWPGGYAGQMSNSLKASTREKIRLAVNERGVSYVGICAGAFIAISPAAKPGQAGPAWGFALVNAETLPYYHLEDEGTSSAMVQLHMADGTVRDIVWWGGPSLPEFPKGVVARYSDTKEAAITQSWAGNGLMTLAGPHPEAPQDWRVKLGLSDSDGMDQDITWNMLNAALQQKPMATLN